MEEERVDEIWEDPDENSTVYQCIDPLITGVGDIRKPRLYSIDDCLSLIPGDMRLSRLEDGLSDQWTRSTDDNNLYRPMRILSSFWQVMQMAAEKSQAELILIDIGPRLGAINRSVLLATDYVAIPLGIDLFSLQGLKNLGPTLNEWRKDWKKRLDHWNDSEEKSKHRNFLLPRGSMQPIGYLGWQCGLRLIRRMIAYDQWGQRIPRSYREVILNEEPAEDEAIQQQDDPYCLATIKHYRTLVPMGRERRKPIFKLTPADGAVGSYAVAVQDARKDFERLAKRIIEEMEDSKSSSAPLTI